ncbi:unnamed protein product [Phytophthora fragariaefolia]|uniref:Unnamed protein product n=1 Tax=Phytophthora fragariaefolia TaxID=1490495 RepID=A0A9W7D2A3_9STRA|nr:unnamed protein product [Phytophthora fragariaefolia]
MEAVRSARSRDARKATRLEVSADDTVAVHVAKWRAAGRWTLVGACVVLMAAASAVKSLSARRQTWVEGSARRMEVEGVAPSQVAPRLIREEENAELMEEPGAADAGAASSQPAVPQGSALSMVGRVSALFRAAEGFPRNSVSPTPQNPDISILESLSPLATSANTRCDGSQMANCLDNGCSRSFGGDCNCAGESCTCNTSPTSMATSREVPQLMSSNTISNIAKPNNPSDGFESLMRNSTGSISAPKLTMLPRFVLQIKPLSSLLRIETIVSMLSTISGVRSVHIVTSRTIPTSQVVSPSGNELLKMSDSTQSSRLVIVRGEESLDLEACLMQMRSLQLAHINVIEQSTTAWARKEVVLRVPDMMCPGNCGTSVLNALRAVHGVEAARLRFEHRQIVVRGDMSTDDLLSAVQDIGFDSLVDGDTLLPRRFRFRVDDLSDVGISGVRLKNALNAVEGVENLVFLTDRVEVLVVAMLSNSSSLVEAAESVGFKMLELSEEAWGIPMEVVQSSLGPSHDADSAGADDYHKSHKCDMNICPQNGCPRYMTTVAHTAALAVGWAVPGCGMSSGGECTCGDSCKCEGCPEHNPAS